MVEEVKENKTVKKTEKKEDTKKVEKKVVKKDKAVANASLRVSPKSSFAVCKMIKGKKPETAVKLLENVIKQKQPVKMENREVPHQKGKGIAGARYPKNVARDFIPVVKQLNANALSLGIENPIISIAMANKGAKVFRKGGKRAKRVILHLEAISKK
jgi:ribosomal protein L22